MTYQHPSAFSHVKVELAFFAHRLLCLLVMFDCICGASLLLHLLLLMSTAT